MTTTKQCPQYSSYIAYSDECVCWNHYKLENGNCVPDTIIQNCPAGTVANISG